MLVQDQEMLRVAHLRPKQPFQTFDLNTERVAMMRRLPADDAFVTSHNLHLTVYGASSINVLPFDPDKNSDQARLYASKYCARLSSSCRG